MDVYLVERHVAHELDTHHDHACNPEEDDVESGNEHIARIEFAQFSGFFGPAKGAERPQCRREPGIEYVIVLAQCHIVAKLVVLANLILCMSDINIAFIVVPGRYAVSPPELAADAPVLDVVHPFKVRLGPVLGNELDLAGLNRLNCRFRQWLDLHVPLVGQVGLDHRVRAVAARNLYRVVFDRLQKSEFFEFLYDPGASIKAIKTTITFGHVVVERCVVGQDVVHIEIVSLADLVVIEVVCGRDFYAARAELRVDVVVGNDRDTAPDDRQYDFLPNEVFVAFVFRVHSDGAVTQHCFRSRGRNDEVPVTRCKRITEVPQAAGFVCREHLEIG